MMNSKKRIVELLIMMRTLPKIFTIEMHDGTKYTAGLSNPRHFWTGFDVLNDTRLTTEKGVIRIDMYQIKDLY